MSTINETAVGHVCEIGETTFRFVKAAGTDFDDQDRICGSLDLPLSTNGQQEVVTIVDQLMNQPIVMVYSAVCSAAQDTAVAIATSHRQKVRVVDSWHNLDHGLWHGKCLEEIKDTAPRFYRQWQGSPETVAPPEGETFQEVKQRCRASVQRIIKKRSRLDGEILVVAPDPLLQILVALFEE